MGHCFNKQQYLEFKYSEIPEEPRQRKVGNGLKKKSRAKARSDHKHIYVVATRLVRFKGKTEAVFLTDEFCSICGKRRSYHKR